MISSYVANIFLVSFSTALVVCVYIYLGLVQEYIQYSGRKQCLVINSIVVRAREKKYTVRR